MTGRRGVREAEMDRKTMEEVQMETRESGVGGSRQNWGKERVIPQR